MTGQRIIRPDTAFSVAKTKQKRPRIEDAEHLKFLRGLKCVICGAQGPDAAHIRAASPLHGKPETGMQAKASDKFAVPLCRAHHDEQHAAGNELVWWASKGVDPFGLALALHSASGNDDIADAILRANMRVR